MASRDLYINLRPSTTQGAFVQSTKNLTAYTFTKFFREEKVSFRIYFLTPTPNAGVGSPASIETGISAYTCRIGIGTPGGDILASVSMDWDTDHFEGVLNINTEEMNDALDASNSGEISSTLEVELKNNDDEATFQQSVTIRDEVLTLDGGVPTPNTETLFADSMEDILTDSNSVAWRRTANDIYADARRVAGGGIAESASGLSVDNLLKTPGLFNAMTVEIVSSGSPSFTATPSSHTDTAVVGGEAGKRYLCRIEVDFACETCGFTGGYQNLGDSTYFFRNGTSPGFALNELTLTDGRTHYQLNYGTNSAAVTEAVYYADIIVESGDTLTLKIDSIDGSMNSPLNGTQGATVTLKSALEVPDGFRNFVQNRHKITGLTGGTSAKLDSIATGTEIAQKVETGTMVAVVISGGVSHYQLVSGTNAESSPDIIRPDDYHGTSNPRVWKLMSTAISAKLAALDALTWTNNTLPIFTGATTVSTVASSSFQAADAELSAIAGLTSAANTFPYFTGSGSAALGTVTSFARTLLDDTTAAAALTTLGAAPLASPALTGTPTAPTAAGGTNTTQIATTAWVLAELAAAVSGVFDLRGDIDASANPNYPAGTAGHIYYVTVAGKVGGASGKDVEVGDAVICKANNAGGTEASVGTSWFVLQKNLSGALVAANNLSDVGSAATARSNLGLVIGTNVQAAMSLIKESVSGATAAAASGINTVALGNAAVASRYHEINVLSGKHTTAGDTRNSIFGFTGTTTDATKTELFLNNSSNRLVLGAYSSVEWEAHFVGRRTDLPGDMIIVRLSGAAAREDALDTVRMIGTPENNSDFRSTPAQVEAASVKMRITNGMSSDERFELYYGATVSGSPVASVNHGGNLDVCLIRGGVYTCRIWSDIAAGGVVWNSFATLEAGTQYSIALTSSHDPRIPGFVVPTPLTSAALFDCGSGDVNDWEVTVELDTTNGALVPKVTAEADKDVKWLCVMKLKELYV